jgi:hypothetical protein
VSGVSYDRCPGDDFKAGRAQIGVNPGTGEPVELNMNGVASVIAVQSALLTVSAAMKAGHEEDFLEKIALCLFGKLTQDPHALCPLLTICSMCLLMLNEQAGVTFKNGKVVIAPPDLDMEPGPSCMYDDEEENHGTDEGPMDRDGAGPSGEGPGGDGISP